jgi:hypothetical protein
MRFYFTICVIVLALQGAAFAQPSPSSELEAAKLNAYRFGVLEMLDEPSTKQAREQAVEDMKKAMPDFNPQQGAPKP